MTRPTDKGAGGKSSYRKEPAPIRHAPVNPEFREEEPPTPSPSKGKGKNRTRNPDDQRNLRFIVLALIVFVLIFIGLELKQRRDAVVEGAQPVPDSAETR